MSAALRGLKAQQIQSQGNALGTMSPFPTPCKGKSKSQLFAHTFALTGQGVGAYTLIPRSMSWALDWLPFQGAPFRALFVYHVRMLRHFLFGSKTRRDFSVF